MKWDYTQYPKHHFHYIHISPPCTEYSRALTTRPRRLEDGDRLAQRGLEILAYLEPRYFTIENPDYLLKTRDFMQPFQEYLRTITYCKYGYKYKKPTSIWTNIPWIPKPFCNKANPCEHLAGKTMHPVNAQKIQKPGRDQEDFRTDDLGKMPPALVQEWVDAMRVQDSQETLDS